MKQPYIVVTVGRTQRYIAIDSCCSCKGAICIEHLDKLQESGEYDECVKNVVILKTPIPINGVEGKGRCQLVGSATLVVTIQGRPQEMEFDLLSQGSTGDAFALLAADPRRPSRRACEFGHPPPKQGE